MTDAKTTSNMTAAQAATLIQDAWRYYQEICAMLQRAAQRRLGLSASARLPRRVRPRTAIADGAEVNMPAFCSDGGLGGYCTATYVAAFHNNPTIIEELLDRPHNGEPDIGRTDTDQTPLHIACDRGHPEAVTMLLQYGANPNLFTKNGWTPCMFAARSGNTECLIALADGAEEMGLELDVNAIISSGGGSVPAASALHIDQVTALNIAMLCGVPETVVYLRDSLGALCAEELQQPKRPKNARKKA